MFVVLFDKDSDDKPEEEDIIKNKRSLKWVKNQRNLERQEKQEKQEEEDIKII